MFKSWIQSHGVRHNQDAASPDITVSKTNKITNILINGNISVFKSKLIIQLFQLCHNKYYHKNQFIILEFMYPLQYL